MYIHNNKKIRKKKLYRRPGDGIAFSRYFCLLRLILHSSIPAGKSKRSRRELLVRTVSVRLFTSFAPAGCKRAIDLAGKICRNLASNELATKCDALTATLEGSRIAERGSVLVAERSWHSFRIEQCYGAATQKKNNRNDDIFRVVGRRYKLPTRPQAEDSFAMLSLLFFCGYFLCDFHSTEWNILPAFLCCRLRALRCWLHPKRLMLSREIAHRWMVGLSLK